MRNQEIHKGVDGLKSLGTPGLRRCKSWFKPRPGPPLNQLVYLATDINNSTKNVLIVSPLY